MKIRSSFTPDKLEIGRDTASADDRDKRQRMEDSVHGSATDNFLKFSIVFC